MDLALPPNSSPSRTASAASRGTGWPMPRSPARTIQPIPGIAEKGLLEIVFSEADGGQGGTLTDSVSPSRRWRRCAPRAPTWCRRATSARSAPSSNTQRGEQKARFLPKLLAGESIIGLGMSETQAGSAVTDLATTAVVEGDRVVANGPKVFSTHSGVADVFLVYVRFGPGTAAPPRGRPISCHPLYN